MVVKNIRQPIQTRSIETKHKIVEAGFCLFGQNGFYKTNTMQIAKKANVSTGIVYGYFNDKKGILIEVINQYITKTYDPIFTLLDSFVSKEKLQGLIVSVLNLAENIHKKQFKIHRELNSISQTDKDINKIFVDLQDEVTLRFVEKLKFLGYKNITNENIHLAMNLIQTYVHEAVYDKHDYINYEKMKKSVVELIEHLFLV